VRFPNNQFRSVRNGFRVTRASLAGNAGGIARVGAENSAAMASIAGAAEAFEAQKTYVLLAFSPWHGVC
jgi:hypothetical protein